jgi:hypothetical protein
MTTGTREKWLSNEGKTFLKEKGIVVGCEIASKRSYCSACDRAECYIMILRSFPKEPVPCVRPFWDEE